MSRTLTATRLATSAIILRSAVAAVSADEPVRGVGHFGSISAMVPPRASSLLTDHVGRELLERQLSADSDHVRAALTTVRLCSPLSCLALTYVADEELASVSYIVGWTQEARDAAFAADAEESLWTLWGAAGWDLDLDDVIEPPAPDRTTRELTQRLLDAGCPEPAGALLMDLAYRLNRAALPVSTTSDFACWPAEHEMDDEPWHWMTAVARPEVVELYAKAGWLRLPDSPALP